MLGAIANDSGRIEEKRNGLFRGAACSLAAAWVGWGRCRSGKCRAWRGKKCKVCHDVGEGAKIKVGPPLNNIVGRKAGSLEAYPYSSDLKALAAQGFVCDEKNLDQYLEKLQDGRQQRENGVPRIEG